MCTCMPQAFGKEKFYHSSFSWHLRPETNKSTFASWQSSDQSHLAGRQRKYRFISSHAPRSANCSTVLLLNPLCSLWRWVSIEGLNMAVLGVHCAQLCASLTMEGRVEEAQRHLNVQQELQNQIRYRCTIYSHFKLKSSPADEDGVAGTPDKDQRHLWLTFVSVRVPVETLLSLLHRKDKLVPKEETIYSNWMDTMVTICEEITTESMVISGF